MKERVLLALKGMVMGVAEVIPGVSGGTIAFITGIYEELLNTIKSFNFSLFATLKNEGFKGLWQAINGNFLLFLLSGMGLGVIVGVFGVSHMMITYPEILWAFFFGLILASFIYIVRQVSQWNVVSICLLVLGALAAYFITILEPGNGGENLFFIFLAGMIAISALILPGISGSFILLLLGMYSIVIPAVKSVLSFEDLSELTLVLVFAAGCLVGLVSFARILSWTFKNYNNQTLAVLSGIMLGSLNKIWPWRNPLKFIDEDGVVQNALPVGADASIFESIKVLKEVNVMPEAYFTGEPNTMYVIIALLIGFGSVFIMTRFQKSE